MFYNSRWRYRAIHEPRIKYEGLISLSPVSFFKYTDSIKILDEEDSLQQDADNLITDMPIENDELASSTDNVIGQEES